MVTCQGHMTRVDDIWHYENCKCHKIDWNWLIGINHNNIKKHSQCYQINWIKTWLEIEGLNNVEDQIDE